MMAKKRFSRTLATFFLWLAFKCDKDYLTRFLKDPNEQPPTHPTIEEEVTEDGI